MAKWAIQRPVRYKDLQRILCRFSNRSIDALPISRSTDPYQTPDLSDPWIGKGSSMADSFSKVSVSAELSVTRDHHRSIPFFLQRTSIRLIKFIWETISRFITLVFHTNKKRDVDKRPILPGVDGTSYQERTLNEPIRYLIRNKLNIHRIERKI